MKIVQVQVEDGEPVLVVRGNHALAYEMVLHWAALQSVHGTSVEERDKAAQLLDSVMAWKKRQGGAA